MAQYHELVQFSNPNDLLELGESHATGGFTIAQVFRGVIPLEDGSIGSALASTVFVGSAHFLVYVVATKSATGYLYSVACSDDVVVEGLQGGTEWLDAAKANSAITPAMFTALSRGLAAAPKLGEITTNCRFATLAARPSIPKVLCQHAQHALSQLKESDLLGLSDDLEDFLSGDIPVEKPVDDRKSLPKVVQAVLRASITKRPLFLYGEAGMGKTHSAYAAAEYCCNKGVNAQVVLVECTVDLQRADLFETDIAVKGTFERLVGQVAYAARLAVSGVKVFLVLDEFPNLPGALHTMLNSMLGNTKTDYWSVATGGAEKVITGPGEKDYFYKGETLQVPKENLIIIATGNIGGDYGTYLDNPAVKERFDFFRVELNPADMARIVEKNLASRGMHHELGPLLCGTEDNGYHGFAAALNLAVKNQELSHSFSLRGVSVLIDKVDNLVKAEGLRLTKPAQWIAAFKEELLFSPRPTVSLEEETDGPQHRKYAELIEGYFTPETTKKRTKK